ncbi:MAG: 2-dehydropantoate 2-reductase [Mycobacterium sp.]
MKTLIVGAGATGGYLGTRLIQAGRDVTFLARARTLDRLKSDGVRITGAAGESITPVHAIGAADIDASYDIVLLTVRSDVVAPAIEDVRAAVGAGTKIVPVLNGMDHLATLIAAFGEAAVLGATAKLATSLLPDGTIAEVAPGVQMEIGSLGESGEPTGVATEFAVDGISVNVVNDIQQAMWEKFAFIVSTAVLTCLAGDVIGAVARAQGGSTLAGRVLDEVAAVAAAEGYPLGESMRSALAKLLTDPTSTFGPSMFRDFHAGRPVETSVFTDLAARARRHNIATPLLDASVVVIDVRANRT